MYYREFQRKNFNLGEAEKTPRVRISVTEENLTDLRKILKEGSE